MPLYTTEFIESLLREAAEWRAKYDRVVRDMGRTCYACTTCGRLRTTKECLVCDRDQAVALLDKALQWIPTDDVPQFACVRADITEFLAVPRSKA